MVSLNKLPGVAQPALQEGRYVGKVIKKRLAGEKDVEPFKYFDKGSMATIGYRSAVADAFRVKVTGVLAYVMWAFVHVWYLIGWGNRLLHPVPVAAQPGVHQEPQPPDHHLQPREEGPPHGPRPVDRPPRGDPAGGEPPGRPGAPARGPDRAGFPDPAVGGRRRAREGLRRPHPVRASATARSCATGWGWRTSGVVRRTGHWIAVPTCCSAAPRRWRRRWPSGGRPTGSSGSR